MNPFTVLLMLPSDWRSDQSCAADEVIRVWVNAVDPDEALETARSHLSYDEDFDPEDFSVVAIYAGHIFDLFQP